MQRPRRAPAILAGVASLVMLAAACGDSPTVPDAPPPAPAPTVPTPVAAVAPGIHVYTDAAADSAVAAFARETAPHDGGAMLARLERDRPAVLRPTSVAPAPAAPGRVRAAEFDEASTVDPSGDLSGFAPAGTLARIITHGTSGNIPMVGTSRGYVEVNTIFNGTKASHAITFDARNLRTGESIYRMDDSKFEGAACTGSWWLCLDKQLYNFISLDDMPSCDVELTANTRHDAWWRVLDWADLPSTLRWRDGGAVTAYSRIVRPIRRLCASTGACTPPPASPDTRPQAESRAPAAATTHGRPATSGRAARECGDADGSGGSGGGGGGLGGGGGTMLLICITWDYYDGNGLYLGSAPGGCRYEWAE